MYPPACRLQFERTDGRGYYTIDPHPQWRIVVLDSFDLSVIGWPADSREHTESVALLRQHNSNEVCFAAGTARKGGCGSAEESAAASPAQTLRAANTRRGQIMLKHDCNRKISLSLIHI